MSSMQKLLGEWQPDLVRWKEMDPKAAELEDIFDMLMAEVKVTFTEDTMSVVGLDKGPSKTDRYTVTSDTETEVLLDVFRGEKKAVCAIEIIDDQHIVFRFKEPKEDMLALMR